MHILKNWEKKDTKIKVLKPPRSRFKSQVHYLPAESSGN